MRMGNICGNSPKGQAPPRDLSSLLVEIRVPDDIERSLWARKFRQHLHDTSDKEAVLDFVIVCNVLRNKESEVKKFQSMKWKIFEINKERRELLKMIHASFFAEDCPTPIPLTNQVLREEIDETLAQIADDSDEKELSQAFDLVWQARCDFSVWKGGLDSAYNKFLTQEAKSSFAAVLLTIL